jgi:hypothetical protein
MQSIMSYGDEVPLRGYGYAGGTADLLELFNQSGGAEGFHVTHWGSLSITPTADTVSAQEIYGYPGGTGNLLAAYNDSIGLGGTNVFKIGHSGNTSIAAASDVVGLTVTGYTGGTADLLDVYNQPSGTAVFKVSRGAVNVQTTYGMYISGSGGQIQLSPSSSYPLIFISSGTGATASNLQLAVSPGSPPYLQMTVGTATYSGVTGTSICTHFVGGICVSF